MALIQSDIIIVDSDQRSAGTVQSCSYNLLNVGGIEGTWELIGYQSKNQFFTVEAGVNDQLHWAEPGALTATVPAGAYTQTTFNAAAKIVMDAASGSTFTFTAAADTSVVTVAIAAGTFNWEFGTVTTRRANFLLGLSPVDTGAAASIVGDIIPDLRLHTHILIDIPQDGNKDPTRLDGTEYSFMVPVDEDFGQQINSRKLVVYQQNIFFSSNISAINVNLFSETGVALVNAPRYVMTLRKLF